MPCMSIALKEAPEPHAHRGIGVLEVSPAGKYYKTTYWTQLFTTVKVSPFHGENSL